MIDFFNNIDSFINSFLLDIGLIGPILGCFCILIESIVPILPLFVFITINFLVFGYFIGFILSFIFTVLGCLLSFMLFRKKVRVSFVKKISNNKKLKQIMDIIDKIKLESLSVIIAIPFTPAFLVNIAAGLSKIPTKKYLTSLIIGKIFLVLFWGFVGTSLVQSLTNKTALIKVIILLLFAYILSKIVSKKFNFD
jgi:uncharacterized membrane protein YdjX (TVP38/TMEM64 family)